MVSLFERIKTAEEMLGYLLNKVENHRDYLSMLYMMREECDHVLDKKVSEIFCSECGKRV